MRDADPRTAHALDEMLARWADGDAAARESIEKEIQRTFEETLAILVLDVSGFSSTVIRTGITAFLAKIQEMRSVAVPAIERNRGIVVKYIGDDVLAVFDTVDHAFAAARDIVVETVRDVDRSPDMRFRVSIGIGYGPTLHVPGTDLWGDEANRAFKLGEDTAEADEIMLTGAAYRALESGRERCDPVEIGVSGLQLEAWVHRPLAGDAE